MDEPPQVVYVGPGTESCQTSETKSDVRAEIDTSAPFESVKEAVCRFGGLGYWKPTNNPIPFQNQDEEAEVEEMSIEKLGEQASELEKDVILKQRETVDILQELESTRAFVEDLKMELRKEASEEEDKENNGCGCGCGCVAFVEGGLKQAQQNLTRTTNGISEIRASMEVFNKKLIRGRVSLSLEKTRERLKQSCLKMSSVEERLNQTNMEQHQHHHHHHGSEILKELQILNSEAEKFKQMGEAAKSEIVRTISMMKLLSTTNHQQKKGYDSNILKQMKEATQEIRSTKWALEQLLNTMEEVAVKEWWGWEHGKKMEYFPKLVGVGHESTTPVLNPTLSIGQILSRKLFLQQELMMPGGVMAEKGFFKRKVSLAQMLGKQNRDMPNCVKVERWVSDNKYSNRKRKELGFAARFPFLAKQNNNQKRKKSQPLTSNDVVL